MIYCILSDIHSNLPALEKSIETAEKKYSIDQYICLGDIIGYGPYPNETVKIIKEICKVILSGNHDMALLNKIDISDFNNYAKSAIEWTNNIISEENRIFLNTLEPEKLLHDFQIVHGASAAVASYPAI